MCECGCTANDVRLTFPGPGKSFYLLTLSRGCIGCDASSGVTIERFKPGDFMYEKQNRKDFTDGELEFEKWSDSEAVAIHTGFLRHEFIKALMPHLVGVSSEEMGEDGKIDEAGADAILEEMYDDAVFKPSIVTPVRGHA